MAFKPTTAQKQAILAEGSTLVSAAAGSGKTAVLVERVVRKLTDSQNPVSADRLLIVTFTNAAALEMRTRIEKRFDEICRNAPNDAALAKQKQMLAAASICTIDSFCIDLVRENFQKVGVTPDFKISDGASLRGVDEAVLDRVLSGYYRREDPAFFELLDYMNTEYDDRNFKKIILDLYDFSRQLPDPFAWFDSLSDPYRRPFSECPFIQKAFEYAEIVLEEASELLTSAGEWLEADPALSERYAADFSLASEKVCALRSSAREKDWDGVYETVLSVLPASLPSSRGLKSEHYSLIKTAWEDFKKTAERLSKMFYATKANIETQLSALSGPLLLLSEILRQFETALFDAYLERNTLTFHNTEHLALALLRENDSELLSRYDEIMVDEYQDTNDLQDMLFQILSGNERLFAVGDVKQSIYGFRGANPNNFLSKSRSAVPYGTRNTGEMQKVILSENFRSKAEICEVINDFFSLIMTGKRGGLIYDREERLVPASRFPQTPFSAVDFDLIEVNANADDSMLAEGYHIAKRIREIMAAPACIRAEDDTLRKAEYSDFAILLRNAGTKAPQLAQALRNEGIPVNFRTEHFATSLEIETFLSLLKVIDNPDSDIELFTTLASPIFGFSPEELAKLRIEKREGSLYSVMVFAAENGNERCGEFLATVNRYRRMAIVLPLASFIVKLLHMTDYWNIAAAMSDGKRRQDNLLLLSTLAESYTADYDGGITGFIEFIKKRAESGLKATTSAPNTVRIMTIHASKGLQFPICILAGVSSKFNSSDTRQPIVYSEHGGIGIKYYDEKSAQKISTPAREVICEELRLREKEEEERLLYVAMTRAQDRLIITCTVKDVEKTVNAATAKLLLFGSRADLACRFADSYADWILSTLLLHPDGACLRKTGTNLIPIETDTHIHISVSEGSVTGTELSEETADRETDEKLLRQMKENLAYAYPYASLLGMQAKASVTSIANKAERAKFAFSDRPAFMSDGGITATQRGTAIHKVMQFFDFEKTDSIEEEISRLYEWQFISEREAESVNRNALKAFFTSNVFGRIKAAKAVEREMRFLTEIPAGEIDPSLSKEAAQEGIMVQGAVDLCFEEEDGIVILDFKTDRIKKPEELKNAYREQLAIYALACEKIWERPVKEMILYSFSLGREIKV